MRVNSSPRVLDSAVTFHFICTACRGVTNTALLQGEQLKSVRGNWALVKMSPHVFSDLLCDIQRIAPAEEDQPIVHNK